MGYATIDDLNVALGRRLAEPGYSEMYKSESAFEEDVWDRVVKLMSEVVDDTGNWCLTSHTSNHKGRSAAAWKAFCSEDRGPDVNILGSNNRLDIVLKHPVQGSIGIEVKCLGSGGHAAKLTQGIGQVMVALAHRDRTMLVIHCGTVEIKERERLRTVAEEICKGTRISIIVVP